MFDDFFDRLSGIDSRKLTETVNFVWKNRAQIADLLERLPTLLRDTGDSIESAGVSAVRAAEFLTGGAQQQSGVRQLAAVAADAMQEGQEELKDVAEMLARLGKELDAINIPSVKPRFMDVAGFQVVSGVDVGRESLFDDVVERMAGGSERLTSMSRNLQTVATQLREMGGLLADMGEDMGRVGTQLQDSGKTLRSLGDFGGDKGQG